MSEDETARGEPERDGTGEAQGWQESVARFVGGAARRASHEVDCFAVWARRTIVGSTARRRTPGAARPVRPLLEQLAQVVASHADTGYGSLEQDPTFWWLVARLYRRRFDSRAGRRRPWSSARAAERGPARQSTGVEATRAEAAPEGAEPAAPQSSQSNGTGGGAERR